MKILVVEDNFRLRENIIKFLKISGILGEEATNGEEALNKVINSKFDCILLDINMPFMNGKEFIKKIRNNGDNTRIIVITSNSMLEDKLELFELGADDYMTKPVELPELLMRIKAITRRSSDLQSEIITFSDVSVDISHHKVYYKGGQIDLTNKEFLIIEYLIRNKGLPKNKTELLEHVWGEFEESLDLNSVTLEAHISTIRKKLYKNFIKTIKGVGYVIE